MAKTTTKHRSKFFNIDIKSIDEQNRRVTFCFSDDKPDRDGEIVDQASWQTDNYMQNPVILWGHDPDDNENVIGQGVNLDLNNNGRSYITAQFDDAETNPKADTIFRQLVKRTIRCVSAGFLPHTLEFEDDTPILKDNELLEVSVVAIPANPRAIALSYKDGSISKKDAQWLMESMRKEAEYLEKQLEETDEGREDAMSEETQKQLNAVLAAVEGLTARMDDLAGKVADSATTKEVAAVTSTADSAATSGNGDQAAEGAASTETTDNAAVAAGTSQSATSDTSQVADESAAADQAASTGETATDTSASDDTEAGQATATDTATTATDSTETAGDNTESSETSTATDAQTSTGTDTTDTAAVTDTTSTTDESESAKDGSNDQSGADLDDIDPEAELTPEMKARIDAALENVEA